MTGHETEPRGGSEDEHSRGHLREMEWVTVSVLIISSDGHLLMGQKDPARTRAHPHVWHLPGGQVEQGESLTDAAVRNVEKRVGLRLMREQLTDVPFVGEDEAVRTLDTGEAVWCRMKLHRFEARLRARDSQLEKQARPGDDFVALRWFSPHELVDVELAHGLGEFFIRAGYVDSKATKRARP